MDIRGYKISFGTILTVVSVGSAVGYGWSLRNMAKKAQFQVSARVHEVTWSSADIAIEARVINPTNGTVRMERPHISLYASDKTRESNTPFATTEYSNETFTIPPKETKVLPTMILSIPLGAILQLIAQGYLNGGELNLIINVQTSIFPRYIPVPISVSHDIKQKLGIPNNFPRMAVESTNPEIQAAVANKRVVATELTKKLMQVN